MIIIKQRIDIEGDRNGYRASIPSSLSSPLVYLYALNDIENPHLLWRMKGSGLWRGRPGLGFSVHVGETTIFPLYQRILSNHFILCPLILSTTKRINRKEKKDNLTKDVLMIRWMGTKRIFTILYAHHNRPCRCDGTFIICWTGRQRIVGLAVRRKCHRTAGWRILNTPQHSYHDWKCWGIVEWVVGKRTLILIELICLLW